jgi:hypothetical protein
VAGQLSGKLNMRVNGREQLRFNRWVAREAHRRGMAVGLKNDP